jgi:GxxExxY protein
MNANAHEDLNQIAHAVIGAAFEVSNTLGAGFLEKVYERARVRQLQMHQLPEGIRPEFWLCQ